MQTRKSIIGRPSMLFAATCLQVLAFSVQAGDAGNQQVIPKGALADATRVLEDSDAGKVLEIRLADQTGDPVFEAVLKRPDGDGVVYMRVAMPGDEIAHIKVSELPQWMVDYHLDAYMRSVDKAKVPLPNAIERAEKRGDAPAVAAGVARPLTGGNTVLAWFVEALKGKKRELLAIDAEDGAPIANPQELYERRTPVELARRLAEAP